MSDEKPIYQDRELRKKQLRHGVRKDGTVEGYMVETYLAFVNPLHSAQYGWEVDHENKFIGFVVDNGGTDLVVRLPFEVIEQFQKWIEAAEVSESSE